VSIDGPVWKVWNLFFYNSYIFCMQFSLQARVAKFDQEYNKTIAYVENNSTNWSKVSSTHNVQVWKAFDQRFNDFVHRFQASRKFINFFRRILRKPSDIWIYGNLVLQVVFKAEPAVIKDVVSDLSNWPSWFQLVEDVVVFEVIHSKE
jgi:hypothetical protein